MKVSLIVNEIDERFKPETETERRIIKNPDWQEGVMWGKPRFGHPEGKVLYHIEEVLENVERLKTDPKTRFALRFITLTHDSFKYREDRSCPRDWSRHHSILAREFSEQFTDNQAILDVIELHDEAYHIWKMHRNPLYKQAAQQRLEKLLFRLNDNIQLFYLFFKCDTQTGDKIQTSITWFEETLSKMGIELSIRY
jgi:hypothetical protein